MDILYQFIRYTAVYQWDTQLVSTNWSHIWYEFYQLMFHFSHPGILNYLHALYSYCSHKINFMALDWVPLNPSMSSESKRMDNTTESVYTMQDFSPDSCMSVNTCLTVPFSAKILSISWLTLIILSVKWILKIPCLLHLVQSLSFQTCCQLPQFLMVTFPISYQHYLSFRQLPNNATM